MNKFFLEHIRCLIEVYDDMLVKMKEVNNLLSDIEVIFNYLRRHNMRLNPQKCTFAVQAKNFLGFMLTHQGIEANPDKCQSILKMKSLTSVKEVQQLTGRIASLSRFMTASAQKAWPFFALLKKESTFEWTSKCEAAFTKFKRYLSSPPILSKSDVDKPLILYLSVSNMAVASTLVKEEARQQYPVYFESKVLQGPEVRYRKIALLEISDLEMEKIRR